MPFMPMIFDAVRLTRPEWKSPLDLTFEGLTDRLGSNAAADIWDALGDKGEHTDSAGTHYQAAWSFRSFLA